MNSKSMKQCCGLLELKSVIIALPLVKFTSFPPDIVDSSLSKGISSCSWTLMHIDGAEAITKMKINSTYNKTS